MAWLDPAITPAAADGHTVVVCWQVLPAWHSVTDSPSSLMHAPVPTCWPCSHHHCPAPEAHCWCRLPSLLLLLALLRLALQLLQLLRPLHLCCCVRCVGVSVAADAWHEGCSHAGMQACTSGVVTVETLQGVKGRTHHATTHCSARLACLQA